MSRSPKKAAKPKLTELVQTLISPEASRLMKARLAAPGTSESAYVRNLIYADLGIIPSDKDRT